MPRNQSQTTTVLIRHERVAELRARSREIAALAKGLSEPLPSLADPSPREQMLLFRLASERERAVWLFNMVLPE